MNEDWKTGFREQVLEQGQLCWRKGCVENLCREGRELWANVADAGENKVVIRFLGRKRTKAVCSCPEGRQGTCCHVAAVRFALEKHPVLLEGLEEEPEPEAPPREAWETDWKECVHQMPREALEAILLELAECDPGLQKILWQQMHPSEHLHMEDLKKQVQACLDACDPRVPVSVGEMEERLAGLLQLEVPGLLASGDAECAFQLICHVFETAMEKARQVRGSLRQLRQGGFPLRDLVLQCQKDWMTLIRLQQRELEESMFSWFVMVPPELRLCVRDVIFCPDWEPRYLKWGLTVMAGWIESAGGEPEPELMERRIAMLTRLGMPLKDMKEDLNCYRDSIVVRRWEIRVALEAGDVEEAIRLLAESRERDRDNPELVKACTEQLMKLYASAGQRTKWQKELHRMVLEYGAGDLSQVEVLKELTAPEEWPGILEEILASPRWAQWRLELLERNGLYEQLYGEVMKNPTLPLLDRYGRSLQKQEPEKTMEVYQNLLNDAMARAVSRKGFQAAANSLKNLSALEGGIDAARNLAARWRYRYPGRRNMMAELRRVGF